VRGHLVRVVRVRVRVRVRARVRARVRVRVWVRGASPPCRRSVEARSVSTTAEISVTVRGYS